MEMKADSMSFTYNNRIAPILERFHLNHLTRLGNIKIDRDLITVVTERWRRGTHSFYFSTGVMTITLEDVLMLWSLPLDGLPVTGDVEQD
jgi:Plant mobile domain